MKLCDLPARAILPLGPDDKRPSMPRREPVRDPDVLDAFARGFALACLIRDGIDPTSALIRGRFHVSVATAKRDRAKALRLAQQNRPKSKSGSGAVADRLAIRGYSSRFDRGALPDTRSQVKGRTRNA